MSVRKPRVKSKTYVENLEFQERTENEENSIDITTSKSEPQPSQQNDDNSNESKPQPNATTASSTEAELAKKELLVAILSKDIESLPDLIQNVLQYTNGSLNYRDGKNQETLIHKCVTQSVDFPIIAMLLEHNARVDARDINKSSALHYAALQGKSSMTNLLLESRANPMLKDKHNQTALHKAAAGNSPAVIEILLSNFALINHKDTLGLTALHVAAQRENYEAVDCLVHKGADILSLSNENLRPVDYIPKEFMKKKVLYSQEGKKVYKFLKRKGGCKDPKDRKVNGRRGHSIGHRPTKSLSHDSGIDTSYTDEYSKEDEVSLYSSDEDDTTALECEQIAQKISNAPRVDRRGFLISDSTESLPPDKYSKKEIAKEEKRTLKWLAWLTDWENAFANKRSKILKYCDYGIPDSVRGQAWKLMSGIAVEGRDYELYHKLLGDDTWKRETKDQIEKDIHRTMPGHILFQEAAQGRQMLTNVLLAYSIYNPEVGYCQGMGFITAMFLMYMPEEDAFWLLDAVADSYGLAGLWKEGMVQVRQCMQTLNNLMLNYTPKVVNLLNNHGIPSISYVPQFFMTGFLYSFPFDMVVRIWDSFWLRRFDFFYAVAVGVFKITESITTKLEMEQMMDFLKFRDGTRGLDFEIDQLIGASIHIFNKMRPSQLREWEEEAMESILGKKMISDQKESVRKHKDLVMRLPHLTHSKSGDVRSPRKIMRKFSASLTHTEESNHSGSIQEVSVVKPTLRKTRKTAKKRSKLSRDDRTLSLPNSRSEENAHQDVLPIPVAVSSNRDRKKKTKKVKPNSP